MPFKSGGVTLFSSGCPRYLVHCSFREVFINRMQLGSEYFGAGKHTVKLIELISAPGQVEGFEGYPNIAQDQGDLLREIVRIANSATDRRCESFRDYVKKAIQVAQTDLKSLDADPCSTGLYGWRTAGASGPGSNYVKYKTQGGQDFYTLTDEFRQDPLLRKKK
jgi:hypothetical protein